MAVFAATVVLVLYPKLWLVPVWLARLSDLNGVLDPDHPGLAELEARVVAESRGAPLAEMVPVIERTVCDRIPYAFDWETWGVMDYLPTVDEVLAQGREDCDGRAVVAASLLRRLGHHAWLVTDLQHMWVVARDETGAEPVEVELMSPGAGAKTVAADETGTHVAVSPALIENLARSLTFGISVFPLGRELIILTMLCAVTLHPRSSARRRVAGCTLLLLALILLRASGAAAGSHDGHPAVMWLALLVAITGWLLLAIKAADRRRAGSQR